MSVINILHISDIHFGCEDEFGDQGTIAKELIKAAHKYLEVAPDICIFSGDLTHKGSTEQFAAAEEWLKELLAPWDCPLFIVPGNHEVCRPQNGSDAEARILASQSAAKEDSRSFVRQLNTLQNSTSLDNFYRWHENAKFKFGQLASDWNNSKLSCHHKQEIDGTIVNVIGINTAIASCSNSDKGKLVVDLTSLNRLLQATNPEKQLVVVVGHHPVAFNTSSERWFAKWNNDVLAQRLSQQNGPHIYIHGHVHKAKASSKSNNIGQQLVVLGAGAAYQGSNYPNKFATYKIDLAEREISTTTFLYEADSGLWNKSSSESYPVNVPNSFPKVSNSNSRNTTNTCNECLVNTTGANIISLGKAYIHTVRSVSNLIAHIYPITDIKSDPRHYFRVIKDKTKIDSNGNGTITSVYTIAAKSEPVHFWTHKIWVEENTPKVPTFIDMQLEVTDITEDGRYEVVTLPACDNSHYKEISIFFLPHILPNEARTIQINYRWPGYVSGLLKNDEVEFEWAYESSSSEIATKIGFTVEFDSALGDIQCKRHKIKDVPNSRLRSTKLSDGNVKWTYKNDSANISQHKVNLRFKRC